METNDRTAQTLDLGERAGEMAANRFCDLLLAGKTVDQAQHIVIREAAEFHPTCGMMVAEAFQRMAA